jgi:hypothetical protein
MKLFLVTNELAAEGPGRVEAVYLVAAESEDEAMAKARARGGDAVLGQRVRALAFEPDGTALVWMGLLGGEVEQKEGKVRRSSGMRVER